MFRVKKLFQGCLKSQRPMRTFILPSGRQGFQRNLERMPTWHAPGTYKWFQELVSTFVVI
ncbi:hypothetical protein A2837_02555 [Candidatus Kaiserbacteria bacterium RIFCSPHIGHO2_01_FULL_46_22]|uniref:Uncharacterized protein n=1 Tax=Candidatus Kaiserbacteria bacterium RIFCSPHIGHO2_01_FULL_46_22 TaxID=1798475 RepID=A0A1F6BWP2_9BACT|nr:MAG: hypothetical protein A2837_02555 [Candidatus Kaiserbacteria bacterium RIFCSPHIGHO2_01_FULL_46_22]